MIVAVEVFFWQVIRPFMLAIFIAIVLAILVLPMHQWLTSRLGCRQRLAAVCTTLFVLFLAMLPISFTMLMAGTQLMSVGHWRTMCSGQNERNSTALVERNKE
ncbi:hypothetical protein [Novipirellula rosea]|uniref:hypothetical protein n=1 Tax=Novipirellula rosea TaxID=1031540 RepID=UPI0031E564E4